MSVSNDMLKKLALYGKAPVNTANENPQVRVVLWGDYGNIVAVKTIGRYPFDRDTQTLTFPANFSVEFFVSYETVNGLCKRPAIQSVTIEILSEQPPADYPPDVPSVARSTTLPRRWPCGWTERWVVESTDSGQVSIKLPCLIEFSEKIGVVSNSDTVTIENISKMAF